MDNKDYRKEIIEMISEMKDSKMLKILHSFILSFRKEEKAGK